MVGINIRLKDVSRTCRIIMLMGGVLFLIFFVVFVVNGGFRLAGVAFGSVPYVPERRSRNSLTWQPEGLHYCDGSDVSSFHVPLSAHFPSLHP